jgi:hypothetical protein
MLPRFVRMLEGWFAEGIDTSQRSRAIKTEFAAMSAADGRGAVVTKHDLDQSVARTMCEDVMHRRQSGKPIDDR